MYEPDIKSECQITDNGRKFWRSRFNTAWLQNPQVILDIGAYDLGDSIRFARAFPDARIYAFEGCPGRNAIISQYVGDYPQIIHMPYAVSDKVGNIEWYSSACKNNVTPEDYGAQGSTLKHSENYRKTFDFIHQYEPVQVPCVTVSHVCGRANVDLAHIDVEGAEIYVIKGFGECRPKLVWVETILDGVGWEGCTKVDELNNELVSMKYRLLRDFGNDRLYGYRPT